LAEDNKGFVDVSQTFSTIYWLAAIGTCHSGEIGGGYWFLADHRGGNRYRHSGRFPGELAAGRIPAGELVDGLLILIGGIVLLTPGLLTDLFGFALLIPWMRVIFKGWLQRKFSGMVQRGQTGIFYTGTDSSRRDFD
jgi:UPF0716 family protein affecting phage T7 exclusion